MFTSKVGTDNSRLLQESNLTAMQAHRAPHHVIQATTRPIHGGLSGIRTSDFPYFCRPAQKVPLSRCLIWGVV